MSKYDQGYASVVFEPSLAAKEPCFVCGTEGILPERKELVEDSVTTG